MIAYYIHIPYCSRICTYCDFFKRVDTTNNIDIYIDSLVKDIKNTKLDYDTIFIGGGTPSIIGIDNFKKIFKELKKDVLEFSVECNPKDINTDLLDLFKENGVTRISLGVQTFNNNLLKDINRDHTKEICLNAIKLINKYDFILNIDMLHSLPNQSMIDLEKDLKIIKNIKIDSISYYSLILEEKTKLFLLYKENKFSPNDFLDFLMSKKVEKTLSKLGFYKYENSNYTRKYESLHNKLYWFNCDYYSSGAGSVSKINRVRYKTIENTKEYINRINSNQEVKEIEENLSLKDEMFESIMLNLRYHKGLNKRKFFSRYKVNVEEVFESIAILEKDNYLKVNKNRIILTKKGYTYQNECYLKLLEDINE